ncbi:uncharacterized protein [Nicotiana tomentosiformis]|uniref:uncharacterized protein n=1 Tax=Nicotiana tomentosiformis TaxID=4098 RepID=UPI00388CC13B
MALKEMEKILSKCRKKEKFERRNRKKEQVHDKKNYNKRSSKAAVATWKDSSDEDTNDNAERTLIEIRESEDEPDEESEISFLEFKDKIKLLSKDRLSELLLTLIDESKNISSEKEQLLKECNFLKGECKNLEINVCKTEKENTALKNQVHELDTTVLELRSENIKLKLGIGKEIASDIQLNLEDDLRKVKDELYKKEENVRVMKEDLTKVKHELDRTCPSEGELPNIVHGEWLLKAYDRKQEPVPFT